MNEYESIEALREKTIPHGALRGCAFVNYTDHGDPHFYHRNAPKINRFSGYKLVAERTDGGVTVTRTQEQPSGNQLITVWRAAPDALAALQAFTERENFAALSTLEVLFPPMGGRKTWLILLDYDSPVPGNPPMETMAVQLLALEERGLLHLAKEFERLLTDVANNAVLVSQQGERDRNLFELLGMGPGTDAASRPAEPSPKPAVPLPEGGWVCPMCKNVNTGNYCIECGIEKP